MTYSPLGFRNHMRDLQWKLGEHVFIAAPSGSGKSVLASKLVERRGHVITFSVKPHDDTLLTDYNDWTTVNSFSKIESWMNRIILRPDWIKNDVSRNIDRQQEVFGEAFDKLLSARNWCVLLDELKYMSDPKFGNLGKPIEMAHYIGRSSGLSIVSLAQRPAHVPLAVLSNASHAYIARTKLKEDATRLSNLGDVDPKELLKGLATLPTKHDFIYTPTQAQGIAGVVNTRK